MFLIARVNDSDVPSTLVLHMIKTTAIVNVSMRKVFLYKVNYIEVHSFLPCCWFCRLLLHFTWANTVFHRSKTLLLATQSRHNAHFVKCCFYLMMFSRHRLRICVRCICTCIEIKLATQKFKHVYL
ncbi:hypothetical protein NP493_8801g00000 [Ridgeia piscesae]|uniref:Uncharacterized protein n=1 Tax=Ridgeia piscesae TaxID=27915 RepID=A0AAD9MJ80_RIDPI|nr:hypothetical protein NP493_8801g00000 [Ridgeia piscesae]